MHISVSVEMDTILPTENLLDCNMGLESSPRVRYSIGGLDDVQPCQSWSSRLSFSNFWLPSCSIYCTWVHVDHPKLVNSSWLSRLAINATQAQKDLVGGSPTRQKVRHPPVLIKSAKKVAHLPSDAIFFSKKLTASTSKRIKSKWIW